MGHIDVDSTPGATSFTVRLTGAVVLPRDHHIIERKLKPPPVQNAIGKSACDQCRYCTEYCPRFLLGHPIEPHRAMQSLGFATGADVAVATLYCCECNLCTMYACPEDLDPKTVEGSGARQTRRGHRAGPRW